LISFLLAAQLCYFLPPEGWDCVQSPKLSEHVQIGFLGKGSSEFRPSLNLATEETTLSLKDYVKAVKEIHEQELQMNWRDLGEFTFRAGKGRLGEITGSSPFGELKMLQGIFLSQGTAYILTAAAHKDDFTKDRSSLVSAIRSLALATDLFSVIDDHAKKSQLQKRFDSYPGLASEEERQKEWDLLQKTVLKNYASLGSYWHFLVLKEGHKQIFDSSTGQKASTH
jgi:hypothetical protein